MTKDAQKNGSGTVPDPEAPPEVRYLDLWERQVSHLATHGPAEPPRPPAGPVPEPG